jgi:hypothetical protein
MRVLVSGADQPVAQVTATLRERGAAVTDVVDLDEMPQVCQAAGPAAFDSYVQLPSRFQVRGDTAIQRVHHFYGNGVLARFGALDAAVPSLTGGARLTFVMGQLPAEVAAPEIREARKALTRVLARAAHADTGNGGLVVRVLEAGTSAEDIAFVALGGDLAKRDLMERLADLNDPNWRVELLGLAMVET